MNPASIAAEADALAARAQDLAAHARTLGEGFAAAGAATEPFIMLFAVFLMAVFVGYYVIWNVTPALHSPLMSVTNAISSVIIAGAMLATGIAASGWATGFGFIAVTLASVNIFGGFVVTQRMLSMFRAKERPPGKTTGAGAGG
jgi:NAD(P) transhydrogenase subunit alpha